MNTLGIGKVFPSADKKRITFKVTILHEISIIIAIFDKYNLNTTKHLDYLAFARAYKLYVDNKNRADIMPSIQGIIREMNKQRTDFNLPVNHFRITPNWLLGFVEGDGSFIYKTVGTLEFSIGQKGNKALLEAIKDYFQALGKYDGNVADLRLQGEGQFKISISGVERLEKVVIPFFDGLIWHTKKYLDYSDWKDILYLRNKGLHYHPMGKILIERIKQQMNNNRLSTSGMARVDTALLKEDIAKLLNSPSNYEIRDGKTYIISLNKYHAFTTNKPQAIQLVDTSENIICTYYSREKCAEDLEISKSGVTYRIQNGIQFTYKAQLVYLKKVS